MEKIKKSKAAMNNLKLETLQIYSLFIPVAILIIIFCYVPMYGVIIAFQDYIPGSPFIGAGVKWVTF